MIDLADFVSMLIPLIWILFVVICLMYVFGKIIELVGNIWKAFEPWRKLKL